MLVATSRLTLHSFEDIVWNAPVHTKHRGLCAGARRHFGATVSSMLRRLRELLDGTRRFGVYVRSASNVADPYSRDVSDSEPPDQALLTQSRNVLLPAQAAAHALFRVSGAGTGCLRRERPSDTTLL
jgi:hypothetical protein